MSIKGWILRVDVDTEENVLIVSIICDDGRYREIKIRYKPKLYVNGPQDELKNIVRVNSSYIIDLDIEKWRLPPWYDREKDLYVLTLNGPREYFGLIKYFQEDGKWVIWNLVPNIYQRFLFENGITVSAYIKMDLSGSMSAESFEDINALEYSPPPFKRLLIRILDWYGDVLNPFINKPKWFEVYYGDLVKRFNDIWSLKQFIDEYDPDIIEYIGRYTKKWLLRDAGLKNILYRRRRVYINYHDNVFNFGDLHGLIELSRLSYTDLSKISRYSIGKVLTTIEAIRAFKLRRAVPEVRVDVENPKSLEMLKLVDRGGLYLIPSPGLYWNVAQCDFSSFYPTIIYKYNIGNETVNRTGCKEYITAPVANHKICLDIKGTVPIVVGDLVQRRFQLKSINKVRKDPIIDSRQNAIKWILVACFGYLGYRNARFGKIEAYECVTSYARSILTNVIKYVINKGFKVIHALVDSIWIYKDAGSSDDYYSLCKDIAREFGINIDVDIHYKWVCFPACRSRYPAPAINRYYGVGFDGFIKVKGIEAVRRDVPNIIKKFQLESISQLAKADNYDEFESIMVDKVFFLYNKYLEDIKSRKVDVSDLIITKRLHRDPNDYINNSMHIRLAKKYGFREGDIVKYIILEGGYPMPVELWNAEFRYDKEYYIKRLSESVNSLSIRSMKKE